MRGRDVVVAAVLFAVGLAATTEARKLAVGSLSRPGPGFFPYTLSLGLVLAAAGLLIQALARPSAGAAVERLMHGRAALTLVITAAYVFALEPIGFGVATALYLMALFRVIEPRRWVVSLAPALGIAAFGSFIVGTLSVLGIMLVGPPLAGIALRFGPPEIFGLLALGFTMVTHLAGRSKLKAGAMALLGLLLATIGLDPMNAEPRFTYGTITLMDGVGLVPLVMGLFGISEVLLNLEEGAAREIFHAHIGNLLPDRAQWKASAMPIARGSVLGFVLGILPGIGAIIPTFISYALEKRVSKHPETFGHGAIEGVAGPESANNAATGGSMIPLLTLGIPPNVVMAVLLGAFLVHGIQPGPLLIREHPDVFWGVIASMYVGNVMLLLLNLPLVGMWVQLLKVPYGVLFPMILIFCVIGVYSLSYNVWDAVLMLAFGVVGYLMKKFEYEPMPLVLAFVLGRMAEEAVRQSLLLSRGRLAVFVERPLAAGFLGAAAVVALLPVLLPPLKAAIRRPAWD